MSISPTPPKAQPPTALVAAPNEQEETFMLDGDSSSSATNMNNECATTIPTATIKGVTLAFGDLTVAAFRRLPFEQRQAIATARLKNSPGHIPVVVDAIFPPTVVVASTSSAPATTLKVSWTMTSALHYGSRKITVGQFLEQSRKRMVVAAGSGMRPGNGLICFVTPSPAGPDGIIPAAARRATLPPVGESLAVLYTREKASDGILYLTVREEAIFG